MNASEIIKNIEAEQLKADAPQFSVGDTVKVYGKLSNGVGVEKTWPLHSPNVEKVEIVRKGKVRRAKLYYLRDRIGKAAKVKELVK